ncbi:MAG: DUF3320 domain-containing protein, partial [bacterium]|nr:DUF3320 domain-containing protein [bacterium]
LSSFRDWQGYTTHPQSLRALLELGQRLRAVVGKFAETPQALIELRAKLHALLQDGNDLLAPEAAVGKTAFAYLKAYASWGLACDAFGVQAGQPVRDFFTETPDALTSIRQEIEQIAAHRAELRDWCHWRHRRKEALAFELEPLVKSIEEGSISAVELEAAFEAAYCTWFSGAIMAEDEVLRTFSTPEHMAEIDFFRKLDDQFLKLTASQIEARLSCQIPNAEDVTRKSSWGVLRREIQKKIRHIPVRQLMKEIPDVLTTLAPCMMMSPLSVAQYLSADQALFDVIIFDEASQITVWDAIGSLARGRQAIVAGDPKQMPPTNFFARADDGSEDEIDGDSDMESILDEMQASNIPERKLNLHYRSRRESLIAFSNNKYYDNELVTFPAPLNPDCGVRLVNPEGIYARGKARHNEGEAKAIVKEIVRRLRHNDPTVRQQSIGVVTFNAEQQSLIQNLLDEACSKHPEIEWAFSADHVLEPVFVKNLETVQGDERDVILFSVTYGPDHSGRVSMNFGPLNKSGGERRLNVAMTRARYEMIVFSTLRPDQINLSRTQAQAVAHLKHFLEYAERGPSALGAEVRGSVGDFDSPFEMAVASALREKGWTVQPQIGVSAYRIDLGVLHPDKPGLYLAGIECDGAMYHSAAFARERDKIRQAVLEGLGWTLLRVWSTDWWTNRAGALDKLHKALQDGLEADRQRTKEAAASAEREGQQEETFPSFENEGDEESLQAETATTEEQTGTTLETATIMDAPEPLPVSSPPQPESPARILDNPSQVLVVPESAPLIESRITRYIYASLDGEAFLPDENLFYLEEYEDRLAKMVCHVIETEGPIHEDVLVRRIARHHGFKRAGRQIREIVLKLAKQCSLKTKEEVGEFFWPKEAYPSHMAWARYQDRDEEMRKIEHICKEELWAINTLLALQGDPQEIARSLGISRLSQDARKRMQKIIAKMAPRDSSSDGFRSAGIPAESNREEN